MEHVNRIELKEDMEKLRKELVSLQGDEDLKHLNYIILISNLFMFCGIATLWLPWYCIFPSILLSTGTFARWTMIAHHTCHGGYDHTNNSRYNRFKFGLGTFQRRFNDWFDWMLPEAWNVEHNNLHHYNLREVTDPDLVEENMKLVRETKGTLILKYIRVFVIATTWKWLYYSPNTFKHYYMNKIDRSQLNRTDANKPFTLDEIFTGSGKNNEKPWVIGTISVMMPYFAFTFVFLPMVWGLVSFSLFGNGLDVFQNALTNVILAEILTNAHSFIVIATNHCGDDLYRFSEPCIPRSGEFYLRQIISSVNFSAGTDLIDYPHGFLNYQIEHHLFPSLSMLSYRRAMPKVKEICKVIMCPEVWSFCTLHFFESSDGNICTFIFSET